MTNEEKKAIERLKGFGDSISCGTYLPEAYIEMKEDIEDVLYLIENQSKEIEELKDKTNKCEYYEMVADELYKNSVRKDKIKAKIEIRKEEKENCKDSIEEKYLLREIYVLQSLLEEE